MLSPCAYCTPVFGVIRGVLPQHEEDCDLMKASEGKGMRDPHFPAFDAKVRASRNLWGPTIFVGSARMRIRCSGQRSDVAPLFAVDDVSDNVSG